MNEITITIRRVTGESLRFKLLRSNERVKASGSMIEHWMKANYFGVELDGKLIIIPMQQIAGIEIDPAPNTTIAHVLKDARPV